jgi:hypothetical protein
MEWGPLLTSCSTSELANRHLMLLLDLDSAVPVDAMSEEQTFRSEQSLSLRLIRLRQKWASASRKFTGSNCSKSSNGSKRFERLEQLERFERSLH